MLTRYMYASLFVFTDKTNKNHGHRTERGDHTNKTSQGMNNYAKRTKSCFFGDTPTRLLLKWALCSFLFFTEANFFVLLVNKSENKVRSVWWAILLTRVWSWKRKTFYRQLINHFITTLDTLTHLLATILYSINSSKNKKHYITPSHHLLIEI